ncbi:hypothetical protein JCM33374_g4704 [Metschnikowia sp. JCM 33374]|nr:hypothetical protein JCM33374_g4704 [Metschnikowia sp. JCM 33374]
MLLFTFARGLSIGLARPAAVRTLPPTTILRAFSSSPRTFSGFQEPPIAHVSKAKTPANPLHSQTSRSGDSSSTVQVMGGPLAGKTPSSAVSTTKSAKTFPAEELEAAKLARLANLGWLRNLPEKWIPYAELMRLEKPVGTLLLLIPSLWGITMAAYGVMAPLATTVSAIALFSAGALIMRGAGCTINDILDRNLDNQVARTVERPIASGRVSVPQAVAFLAVQCLAGLAVLLSLPFECFWLGAWSLPFVFSYPLFKRFTYYPQVMISINFSWGCLLGFPAVLAPLNLLVAAPLFLSNFLWSMIYDTIYAHQDKRYDIKAGIKSTALAWGDKTKPIVYGLYTLQVASFLTAGVVNSMGPFFYLGAAWGFQRLFSRIRKVDLDVPSQCWEFFTDNIKTGWILWLGMFLDYLAKLGGLF